MQESMYYRVEIIQRPAGVRDWDQYSIGVQDEVGYAWNQNEHESTNVSAVTSIVSLSLLLTLTQNMISTFTNDNAYIATQWLLRQVLQRGHTVETLIKVIRRMEGTETVHVLALLRGGSYVCDCMMGTNKGIPCRHYFAVLQRSSNVSFSLSLVGKRCVVHATLI